VEGDRRYCVKLLQSNRSVLQRLNLDVMCGWFVQSGPLPSTCRVVVAAAAGCCCCCCCSCWRCCTADMSIWGPSASASSSAGRRGGKQEEEDRQEGLGMTITATIKGSSHYVAAPILWETAAEAGSRHAAGPSSARPALLGPASHSPVSRPAASLADAVGVRPGSPGRPSTCRLQQARGNVCAAGQQGEGL
jgi:hypothetical protein